MAIARGKDFDNSGLIKLLSTREKWLVKKCDSDLFMGTIVWKRNSDITEELIPNCPSCSWKKRTRTTSIVPYTNYLTGLQLTYSMLECLDSISWLGADSLMRGKFHVLDPFGRTDKRVFSSYHVTSTRAFAKKITT